MDDDGSSLTLPSSCSVTPDITAWTWTAAPRASASACEEAASTTWACTSWAWWRRGLLRAARGYRCVTYCIYRYMYSYLSHHSVCLSVVTLFYCMFESFSWGFVNFDPEIKKNSNNQLHKVFMNFSLIMFHWQWPVNISVTSKTCWINQEKSRQEISSEIIETVVTTSHGEKFMDKCFGLWSKFPLASVANIRITSWTKTMN